MQQFIRHTAVIYLGALMLLKMLAVPLVLVAFNSNRAYIAATLCENTDKPQMHCNGRCFLEKELNHASDHTDATSHNSLSKTISVDYCERLAVFSFNNRGVAVAANFPLYHEDRFSSGYNSELFRPPAA